MGHNGRSALHRMLVILSVFPVVLLPSSPAFSSLVLIDTVDSLLLLLSLNFRPLSHRGSGRAISVLLAHLCVGRRSSEDPSLSCIRMGLWQGRLVGCN